MRIASPATIPTSNTPRPKGSLRRNEVNDPLFQRQWDLYEAKVGVDAPAAWGGSTGRGVIVAVVDTGIRPHPDLIKKTLPGYNFVTKRTLEEGRKPDGTDPGDWCPLTNGDSTWHGTHVAGTIAAETNNGLGIAGIAPDAKIVPVRVLGHCGGSTLDIADGILWAAGLPVGDGSPLNPNPAKVINMSLGGDGACGARYADVIRQARAKGVTIVVAAGNSNDDVAGHTPANCEGVIAVAATTRTGARASYSNFGGLVKIAAPGGETQPSAENGILSTLNRGKQAPGEDVYAYYQGTSMASPHVAGIVALAVQLRPGISPDEVLQVLQNSAQPFPSVSENQCSVGVCGAGIANAAAVVQTLSSKSAAVKTQAAPVPVNAQAAPAPVKSAARLRRRPWRGNGCSATAARSSTSPMASAGFIRCMARRKSARPTTRRTSRSIMRAARHAALIAFPSRMAERRFSSWRRIAPRIPIGAPRGA